jgi:ParB family transcriptional regulator, chromosome partitioning protein
MRTRLRSFLEATELVEMIPMKSIVPSRFPLRAGLGNTDALAASIRRSGLLEPIIVRPLDSKYEIVAGHRRFEACRRNRFHEMPAIVKDVSDRDAYAMALEENLQRETLDPIDEASSFKEYVSRYGYGSETELAERIGKSEEYVSHRMMLLTLPEQVKEQVRRRLLSPSDAWEISRVKVPGLQMEIARTAVSKGSTVRQIREVANLVNVGTPVQDAFGKATFRRNREPGLDAARRREAKVKSAALTTLRMAMIRLDGLAGTAEKESPALKKELAGLRLSIHDLVGQFQGGPALGASPSEEIASLVKDRFLNYFNSGKVGEIAKLRDADKFTIFDDYPLPLMDLKQSLKHDLAVARTARSRKCEVQGLQVRLFGNGDGAVATFTFLQKHKRYRRVYGWKSRVSFVFERYNGEWRIVHEHWSEADPKETTIRRIRVVNSVPPQSRGQRGSMRKTA